MASAKSLQLATILPKEILVMIFKKLGYKSLSLARDSCKNWRKVIDDFNLLEPASSKSQTKLSHFI